MNITENFSWEEMGAPPDHFKENVRHLAFVLEAAREVVGRPIKIHSGFRSREHNAAVNGAPYSQHLFGRAADFSVQGWSPIELAGMLRCLIEQDAIPDGGIGTYANWIHYDMRGSAARWGAR